MPNLKDLKNRIGSVKNTQKITKAMQMVAASKLRRAQERAEASRPYASKMEQMLISLAAKTDASTAPALLTGRTDADGNIVSNNVLLVAITADRGLCAGFNGSIVKATLATVRELEAAGKQVKVITVGKKGRELIKFVRPDILSDHYPCPEVSALSFADAHKIGEKAIEQFNTGEIDSCKLMYNTFVNALTQEVTPQQLIPVALPESDNDNNAAICGYEYEPSESAVLDNVIPRNIDIQIYHALLESGASEMGARMTAMDNATRNAGDMIGALTLKYNRTRQAAITTELTEIIAGAESV